MTGLGWQEIVIVSVLLLIGWGPPIVLIVRALRHRARQEALRERLRQAGLADLPIYAGFWDRAGASILDDLVLLFPTAAIQFAALALARDSLPIIAFFLAPAVWVVYSIVGNGRGATLGKRWAGLRIVDAAGAVPGLQRASVRVIIPLALTLLSFVPVARPPSVDRDPVAVAPALFLLPLAYALILAVDILWMIWDPRKQTLHDKLAGTFVIIP